MNKYIKKMKNKKIFHSKIEECLRSEIAQLIRKSKIEAKKRNIYWMFIFYNNLILRLQGNPQIKEIINKQYDNIHSCDKKIFFIIDEIIRDLNLNLTWPEDRKYRNHYIKRKKEFFLLYLSLRLYGYNHYDIIK